MIPFDNHPDATKPPVIEQLRELERAARVDFSFQDIGTAASWRQPAVLGFPTTAHAEMARLACNVLPKILDVLEAAKKVDKIRAAWIKSERRMLYREDADEADYDLHHALVALAAAERT